MTTTRTRRKPLVAVVGTACAAWLCTAVPGYEGMVLRGYLDPVGIVSACAGTTKYAVMGKTYTLEECTEILHVELVDHAEGVLACVPGLTGGPLAATVSFTYNVGTGAFCRSTMARKFNAGDIPGGCAELDRWIYAKGRVLPGLVKRRASERKICEEGL